MRNSFLIEILLSSGKEMYFDKKKTPIKKSKFSYLCRSGLWEALCVADIVYMRFMNNKKSNIKICGTSCIIQGRGGAQVRLFLHSQ